MLRRVAQKHKSQALEADALHFTTDIWSSGVVLVGLLCVQASEYLPADSPFRGILHMADAIAALFVSGIVVVVGFRLSRRAVTMLLDGGGKEHSEALEQALAKQLPSAGCAACACAKAVPTCLWTSRSKPPPPCASTPHTTYPA